MTSPDGDSEVGWQRVHPITPFLKGWQVFVIGGAIALNWLRDLGELPDLLGQAGRLPVSGVMWVIAGFVAIALLVGVYCWVAWRMTAFRVTQTTVEYRSGILFRTRRQARLDRVQGIDIVQPLLARLVGLAQLNFQLAGSAADAVKLAYLKEAQAQQLRAELLAKAAGIAAQDGAVSNPAVPGAVAPSSPASANTHPTGSESPTSSSASTAPDAAGSTATAAGAAPPSGATRPAYPDAPEITLYELRTSRLVASIVRSSVPIVMIAGVVMMIGTIVASRSWQAAFTVLPWFIMAWAIGWNRLAGEFGFTLASSPDGVRVRRGMLETRAQTVPPGRIAALRFSQPLLWRRKGWWRVQMDIAGYSAEAQEKTSVLAPAATLVELRAIIWAVTPALGDAEHLGLLEAGAHDPHGHADTHTSPGSGGDGVRSAPAYIPVPRRARILDPLVWRHRAVATGEAAIYLTGGWLTREVVVVPHARIQSLALAQGPWQRRCRLATLNVHVVPGPVHPAIAHLDEADAAALLADETRRARAARVLAGPAAWMRAKPDADRRRVEQGGQHEVVSPPPHDGAHPDDRAFRDDRAYREDRGDSAERGMV